MKKRFLCLALVLVMLVGIIPFSAVTAFAADSQSENTPVTYSGDVVNVTTWEELKAALEAEGTATVVVKEDITKTISFAAEKGDSSDWHAKQDACLINQKGNKTLVLEKNVDVTVTELFLDSGKKFRGIIKTNTGSNDDSLTIEGPGSFLGSANAVSYSFPFDGDRDNYFTPVVIHGGGVTINGGTIGGKDTKNNLFGAIASFGKVVINGGVVQGVANAGPTKDITHLRDSNGKIWKTEGYYTSFAVITGTGGITINGGEIKSITAENCFDWMRWFGGYVDEAYIKTPAYGTYHDKAGADHGWYNSLPGTVLSVPGFTDGDHGITVNGGKFTSNQKYCKAFGEDKNYNAGDYASAGKYSSNKYTSRLYAEVIEKMPVIMAEGTSLTFNADYNEFTVHPTPATKAIVNGKACADGETVQIPLVGNSVPVTFTWNGLDESVEDCTLIPSIKAYINGTQFAVSYTPEKNPDGTYSVTFNPGIGYEGQTMKYVLDLYVDLPNKCQVVIDSLEVNFAVVNDTVGTAKVTVGTPIVGQTPADFVGTENTDGISIVSGTWYEHNGSSLKKMNDSDKFVAGKNYVYGVTLALDKGYNFGEGFKTTINGINAKKNGDYFNWTSAKMTAKAELVANAVNSTVTVANGDTVTLKVNAKGEGLEYVWQVDETVGAPSIDRNFHDNVTLTCVNAGTYTYKCFVEDANGSRKAVEFTVKVLPKETSGTVPGVPEFRGTGFIDIEDSNNIMVEKGGSITLIPNYVFNMNSNDITTTPVVGEVSFTWEIYDASPKKIGEVTTETLVIDADSEIINSNTGGTYTIILTIANTVDDVHESNFTVATVTIESTSNFGGKIDVSTSDYEGMLVHLVKEGEIAYTTEVDAEGRYQFTNIPYGSYSVKVEKEGYEYYNEYVEVNQAEVTHDITIIIHVCFADEGMTMHFPAKEPICATGELGNIEYRGCNACGKYYDMEGKLIADSANDPGSLNEFSVPYKAIIYPVHNYCGEAQEGANADQYLRHRAETCLENTTYWYYCVNGTCGKSAGDDPSAIDMYYVGNADNQSHSYTAEIADENYFYQGETCKDKIWFYHACEYCGAKGTTVWESNVYGAHDFGTELKHDSENHWYECACGEKKDSAAHTPNADDGDCTTPILCSGCGTTITEAKANHTAGADDGDCTTAVKCVDCDKIAIEAKAAHADADANGKCDTCGKDMPKADDPSAPTPDLPNTDTDKETNATDDESKSDNETDAPVEKGCGGCGSCAALSALAIVAVVGSALVIKKKED